MRNKTRFLPREITKVQGKKETRLELLNSINGLIHNLELSNMLINKIKYE